MNNSFSNRFGYAGQHIVIENAPPMLRQYVYEMLEYYVTDSTEMFKVVTQVCPSYFKIEINNYSGELIAAHTKGVLSSCDWSLVYDIIEAIAIYIKKNSYSSSLTSYIKSINEFFIKNNIGWTISKNGIVERRYCFITEKIFSNTQNNMILYESETAQEALIHGINALSKRPNPDITVAIYSATAALECFARTVTGNRKMTLGKIINENKNIFPPPIDVIAEKIWGFSSNNARHLNEGGTLSLAEAELIVGLSNSLINYLAIVFKKQ